MIMHATHTHLQDAVVRSFGVHDSCVAGEGPEPQRQFHQLFVFILHQMIFHVAAAAECQRVAIYQVTEIALEIKQKDKDIQRHRHRDVGGLTGAFALFALWTDAAVHVLSRICHTLHPLRTRAVLTQVVQHGASAT